MTTFLRFFLALTIVGTALHLERDLAPKAFLIAGAALLAIDALLHDFLAVRCRWVSAHRSHLYTAIAALCIAAIFPPPNIGMDWHWHWMALLAQAAAACALAIADTHRVFVKPRKDAQ